MPEWKREPWRQNIVSFSHLCFKPWDKSGVTTEQELNRSQSCVNKTKQKQQKTQNSMKRPSKLNGRCGRYDLSVECTLKSKQSQPSPPTLATKSYSYVLTGREECLSANHLPVAPLHLQAYGNTARSLGYPLAVVFVVQLPLLYTVWSNAYWEIGSEVCCDLSRLLARKITKHIHSSKPASLNHPISFI